jgi:hypothetical protein
MKIWRDRVAPDQRLAALDVAGTQVAVPASKSAAQESTQET